VHSLLTRAVVLSQSAPDAPAAPPMPNMPAAALPAAERGPLALALVLAGSGIPAGVVTSDPPDEDPGVPVVSSDAPPVESAAVARRLVARYPAFAVEWRREVMGIELRRSVCAEQLTATTVGPVTIEGQAGKLLVLLGWMASRDSSVHTGVVSRVAIGRGSPELTPPAPARSLRVALTSTVTLRDALDQVVRENDGGVWIVWQRSRPGGAVGCRLTGYLADGIIIASNRDFAVVP
jgi:hypothetical protein